MSHSAVSRRKGRHSGAQFAIGGINPELMSPTAYIVSAAVERQLGHLLAGSIIYSGSHSENLVGNGNQLESSATALTSMHSQATFWQAAGSPPTRLNSSFGPILYADNDRVGNYNGMTFDLRGRGRGLFFDVSYTRSSSKDDAAKYPTAINPHQFYGPSPWDVPHRLSLTANYTFPAYTTGGALVNQLASGWGVSAIGSTSPATR